MRSAVRAALGDLRLLGECVLVTIATWFLLGSSLARESLHQADGSLLDDPLLRSALEAGPDWTHHLYRIGLIGGSKLHEFAGTTPLVQVLAVLGVSTTTAANVLAVFVQVAFGYFGLVVVRAMRAAMGQRAPLSLPARVGAIWICAFAPALAWRLAVGHENLLFGLLPFVVALALVWAARERQVNAVMLAFGAFVVANGVSGLGAQMVIYGVVFGTPLVVGVVLDAPRGQRWTRDHWLVVAALLAGVLVMLPRVLPMLAHATGPDATRALGMSVTYSYGEPHARDWIESLPWTPTFTMRGEPPITWHERNYPVGPLLAFLVLLWHRRRNAWLGAALVLSTALGIAFALDIRPISTALLTIPALESFRVPARATLVVVAVMPSLFVGALLAWPVLPATAARRLAIWIALLAGLLVILARQPLEAWAPDVIGWTACIGLVVLATCHALRAEHVTSAVVILGALTVLTFDVRFPRDLPRDPIEEGPAALRAAMATQLGPNATAFDRVQLVDPPPPYLMSLAWAAGIPSLDGVWYPPRRFLDLVSDLGPTAWSRTAAAFEMTRDPTFPVLQQLYNVRLLVSVDDGSVRTAPPTSGAAWFPRELERVDDAADFARAMSAHGTRLPQTLHDAAWLLRSDGDDVPMHCADGRVTRVDTDALGQAAMFGVTTTARCLLVVSTNYVSTLRATARVDGIVIAARIVPIDIALVGIVVPAGATQVTLAPVVEIPWWTTIAAALGGLLLVLAVLAARPREAA